MRGASGGDGGPAETCPGGDVARPHATAHGEASTWPILSETDVAAPESIKSHHGVERTERRHAGEQGAGLGDIDIHLFDQRL